MTNETRMEMKPQELSRQHRVSTATQEDIFGPDIPDASTAVDASPSSPAAKPKSGMWVKLGIAAAILGGLYFGTVGSNPPVPTNEKAYANWAQQVEPANAGFKQTGKDFRQVNAGGVAVMAGAMQLNRSDLDGNTTVAVRKALQSHDHAAAQAALQQAQQIRPPSDPGLKKFQKVPTLTPGMEALVGGGAEFAHVFLYDACQEDGDVVEILINGESFATVTLTHAGATLSVPVPSTGQTQVALKGIHDGGGGITVACRSSAGDHFGRAMDEGQIVQLGLVAPR
jgi:hypothetical protein